MIFFIWTAFPGCIEMFTSDSGKCLIHVLRQMVYFYCRLLNENIYDLYNSKRIYEVYRWLIWRKYKIIISIVLFYWFYLFKKEGGTCVEHLLLFPTDVIRHGVLYGGTSGTITAYDVRHCSGRPLWLLPKATPSVPHFRVRPIQTACRDCMYTYMLRSFPQLDDHHCGP
jgi:hypothetical protein